MKRKQSEDVATPTICHSDRENLLEPCAALASNFQCIVIYQFSIFPCLYLTVQLIDVNGLLQPGRLSNQTAKRRLYRHIEAYRLPLWQLHQRRVKSWRQLGGVCLSCGCIWIAFACWWSCLSATDAANAAKSIRHGKAAHFPHPHRRCPFSFRTPPDPTRSPTECVLRRTAHISNLLNDICLERWAQWICLLYTCICICLDIFAPMAPKHQFLISLAWRGPRAPLWFFIICFSNLHLPVLCFGYSTRHFPVHGLPI